MQRYQFKGAELGDIKKKIKSFSRKITYNNSDDKFKLKQYENELENILINKVVEDLIVYLTNIE